MVHGLVKSFNHTTDVFSMSVLMGQGVRQSGENTFTFFFNFFKRNALLFYYDTIWPILVWHFDSMVAQNHEIKAP